MFFTASITSPQTPASLPGATEPGIGALVSDNLNMAGRRAARSPDSSLSQRYLQEAAQVNAQTLLMSRGGDVTWYGFAQTPKEDMMTYVCDANLGAPSEVDCSQLEYTQLGGLDDTLQVGPGVVKFLTSSKWRS